MTQPALSKLQSSAQQYPRKPALRYLLVTGTLMLGFYALLYRAWDPNGFVGGAMHRYLHVVAAASGTVLRACGESVSIVNTTVSGRFSYLVVLDCAALDAQALFAAAVLAFPARLWMRGVGLIAGMAAIFCVNVARLVALYYAGAKSMALFRTLHEEVFVFVIIALVCAFFLVWARWAQRSLLESPLLRIGSAPERKTP